MPLRGLADSEDDVPDRGIAMKRQQVLADFGELAIRSDDLDDILTEACRLVAQALGTRRAWILEILTDNREMFVRAGVGCGPNVVGTERIPMKETSPETLSISMAEPVIIPDISREDRFTPPAFMTAAGVVTLVNVPIFLPGRRPYGILQVDSTTPRDPDDDDMRFLRTYASILGPVIDRLHLVQECHTTENRLRASEDRQRLLLQLSDAIRPLTDADEIRTTGARILGRHLGANRVAYAEDVGDGQHFDVCCNYLDGANEMTGRYRYADFGPDALGFLQAGIQVHDDIAAENRLTAAQKQSLADDGVAAALNVPCVKRGQLLAWLGVSYKKPHHFEPEEIDLVKEVGDRTWAAIKRARAEAALRESEEGLRAIMESALDYAIFTTDVEGRIETWSPGAQAVFGWTAEQAIGQDMAMTFTPEDRARGVPWGEMAEAREHGCAPNVRWHLRNDGRRVFIEGSTRPLGGSGAGPRGFLKIGQDVTQRKHWDERQKVLVAELQHRTRNLLAVVRSMAEETIRSSADLQDFGEAFRDRMEALARVQSLLSRLEERERIAFDLLIRTELMSLGVMAGSDDRVSLDGPDGVRLRSSAVQTLALALHELATNATKYGALSQHGGQLAISWRVAPVPGGSDPWLHIDWRESGVAMPDADALPSGTGQGRELIERALPYQLQARTSYELGRDGVHCTISIPVSAST